MDNLQKCAYTKCTNEFEPREGKRYCSNNCRSKACLERKKLGGVFPPGGDQGGAQTSFHYGAKETGNRQPATGIKISGSLSPLEGQLLLKEAERWETAYKEERAARKKLKEENEKLRTKLAETATDQKIKDLEAEHKKPSGLAGLAEDLGPLLNNEYIGPVIGSLISKLATGAVTSGIAGASENGQSPGALIAQFIDKLPEDVKANFWASFEYMVTRPEEEVRLLSKNIKQMTTYYANDNN